MKRLIVAVVALVAVFALSSASVYAVEGLSAGVKAGLNISNAYGDDVEGFLAMAAEEAGAEEPEKKMKIGVAFGAFVNYTINDYLAVQPELLFTMKGVKGEADVGGDTAKGTVSLNYLEFPILAKVSMPMEGKVKPCFLIGPALGILLTAKVKGELDGDSATTDIKDDMKAIDFGLVFGAGVDVEELGPGNLTVDARYTLGLMDVPDVEGIDIAVKNAVISIMAGYSFPL